MTVIPEIEILADHPETGPFALDDLRQLIEFAISQESTAADLLVVNVLLTDDERMRTLHRDFLGLDSPTDIMTFPSDLEPGAIGRGGDIVISIDTARENGVDAGWSTWDEVRFLVVHGVLHLSGWDDHDAVARDAMLARQRAIIQLFDAAD